MIDIKDIRSKGAKDLEKMLDDLLDEQMKLRLQFVTGQVTNLDSYQRSLRGGRGSQGVCVPSVSSVPDAGD